MSSNPDKKYKIVEDPEFGRHLIAVRDILPGEIIIDEPPLVAGPVSNLSGLSPTFTTNINTASNKNVLSDIDVCPVCCSYIKANNNPDDITIECDKCSILLCSISCKNDPLHSNNECRVFQNLPKNLIPWSSKKILYNFINTIRCLFLRIQSPSVKWAQMVQLESKVKELEKAGTFSKDFDSLFKLLEWKYFCDNLENPSPLPKEDILKAARHCLGAMRINAFSSFTQSNAREGLYFLSSLMSHSCVMNTDRQMDHDRMVTRAAKEIKKGDSITTSYLSYMNGTYERFSETKSTWFFVCTCKRCIDPTEFGTHMSTVSCPSCNQLSLNPHLEKCNVSNESPYGYELDWKCSNIIDCKYILIPRGTLPPGLAFLEESRPSQLTNIDEVENWLDSFSDGSGTDKTTTVHLNHAILVQIKLYLCQYYGRNSQGISRLCLDRLQRKVKYCKEILEILDVLFNGIYMIRGIVLFELWSASREINYRITHKQIEDNSSKQNNFLKNIDLSASRMEELRNEALSILRYALSNSSEESMEQILSQTQP